MLYWSASSVTCPSCASFLHCSVSHPCSCSRSHLPLPRSLSLFVSLFHSLPSSPLLCLPSLRFLPLARSARSPSCCCPGWRWAAARSASRSPRCSPSKTSSSRPTTRKSKPQKKKCDSPCMRFVCGDVGCRDMSLCLNLDFLFTVSHTVHPPPSPMHLAFFLVLLSLSLFLTLFPSLSLFASPSPSLSLFLPFSLFSLLFFP